MRRYCFIFPLLLVIAASCASKAEKEKSVLSSLLGREVTIPDSLVCRIQDTEIDYDMDDADFKIITYIDSSGCTACRMKLQEWDKTINGFMSNDNVDVAFLMILNTRNYNDVNTTLNHYRFNHPVMFDSIGAFMESNSLPDETMYHTLLLDADNRIVAVGNPALNPKIRDIYSRIINGEERIDAPNLCPEPVAALGAIGAGDTIVKRFALNNRTAAALTIQEIVPSCDCVSAVASSGVIQPDSTAMVTVTFVPDSVSGYMRRHIDIFYIEKENPERITLHGFIL